MFFDSRGEVFAHLILDGQERPVDQLRRRVGATGHRIGVADAKGLPGGQHLLQLHGEAIAEERVALEL